MKTRIVNAVLILLFAFLIAHVVWRVTHRWYFVSYEMVRGAE